MKDVVGKLINAAIVYQSTTAKGRSLPLIVLELGAARFQFVEDMPRMSCFTI